MSVWMWMCGVGYPPGGLGDGDARLRGAQAACAPGEDEDLWGCINGGLGVSDAFLKVPCLLFLMHQSSFLGLTACTIPLSQVATVACVCGVALASCGALYATYRLLRPSSSSSSSSTSTAGNTSSRLSSSVNSTREGASNSSSSSGGENGGSVLLNLTEYAGSALSRLPVILGGLVGASSSREDSHSNNSSSSGGGQSGHGEGGQQGGGGAGLGAFLPSLRAHSVAEGPCSCYSAGPGTGLFNRPPPAASVPHASYPLCIAGGEALGVWPMLPEP
eukprot:scaffold202096_cov18-Tisochrysis_lutea.AAC.1